MAWMLPGRITVCAASPRVSFASVTVGTACAFAHCVRFCVVRDRLMRPLAAKAPAATRAIAPASRSWRGVGVSKDCEDIVRSDLTRRLAAKPPALLARGRGHGRD